MKTKLGRPALPKGEAKGEVFSVRLSKDDAKKVWDSIGHTGDKKPEWLRRALLSAASGGKV